MNKRRLFRIIVISAICGILLTSLIFALSNYIVIGEFNPFSMTLSLYNIKGLIALQIVIALHIGSLIFKGFYTSYLYSEEYDKEVWEKLLAKRYYDRKMR